GPPGTEYLLPSRARAATVGSHNVKAALCGRQVGGAASPLRYSVAVTGFALRARLRPIDFLIARLTTDAMSTLQELRLKTLTRGAVCPAIDGDKRWLSWADLRPVADRVNALVDSSGADPLAPVALVPRNRPSALAALVGLIAGSHNVRMVHVYQSPAGI